MSRTAIPDGPTQRLDLRGSHRLRQWGEHGRTLVDEAADALAEVRAVEGLQHQAVGLGKGTVQLVGSVPVELRLNDRHSGRRAVQGKVSGVVHRPGQDPLGRKNLTDETNPKSLVGREYA